MQIAITKLPSHDRITAIRRDGSQVETTFPKKGPVPHDAVHWFVERELGLAHGFWGTVAAGRHPEEIVEIAKAAGHASASRAQVPDASIVELLQAERLVECFEADLWGPGTAAEDIIAVAETACRASFVPLPVLDAGRVEVIASKLRAFAAQWIAAPLGHEARFDWE